MLKSAYLIIMAYRISTFWHEQTDLETGGYLDRMHMTVAHCDIWIREEHG